MVSSVVHSKVDDFRPVTSSVVILLLGHYLVLPAGLEPVPLRSQPPSSTSPAARMDEHPAALHLAVAYTSHTETVAVRTVNRTLQQLAPELASLGITLSPLYTALGDRFSASVLANLCESWNSSTVLAALVLADHLPGLLPALAAVSAGVPVLWVTGHVRQGYLEPVSMSSLELRMEVSAREMMRALRSLLLQAHWHTFSLVSAVAHPLPSAALHTLRTPPLQPLFRTLRPDASTTVIFRILSEISRATKGVVVLISDGRTAKRIMAEAARLNMVAGNFVWIWIDSDARVTSPDSPSPTSEPATDHVTEPLLRRRKTRESTSKIDRASKVDRQSRVDRESKVNKDSASFIKLELESIVNSVIEKQIRNSDKQSDSGDILRNNGVRLRNNSDKLRSIGDSSRNNGDKLRSNVDDLRNNGDKLRNNGDELRYNGDKLSNDKLRNNNDEPRRKNDKESNSANKMDIDRYNNVEGRNNGEESLRNNNLGAQLELEMETIMKSVIDKQIRNNDEENGDSVNKLGYRFDKSIENSNLEMEESLNGVAIETRNNSEKLLEGLSSNSSLTPNSLNNNLTDSDNRLRGDVYEIGSSGESEKASRKLEKELKKPLVGSVDQVSWDTVKMLKENEQRTQKFEDSATGYSEHFEVRSSQNSNKQSPNLPIDSHSDKSTKMDEITASVSDDKIISIKTSEVEYFGEVKQHSNEIDEYKEYLCSSSAGVHEEHKQDEICREFRIKKHQLMKTIKVREGESARSSKNIDFVHDLATVRDGGKKFEFKKSVTGMSSRALEHAVDSGKINTENLVIDSRRTSSSNSENTDDSHRNNKVSSLYKQKDGELFENRTILPRSTLRRVRRNAKNTPKNVAKSTIPARTTFPARSTIPAKTFPANSGDIERENSTAKIQNDAVPPLPVGLLAIRPVPFKIDRHFVRSAVRTVVEALKRAVHKKCEAATSSQPPFFKDQRFNCWTRARRLRTDFTDVFSRELRLAVDEALAGRSSSTNETGGNERMAARIQILNLVPEKSSHNLTDQQKKESREWRLVGEIVGHSAVRLDSIVWPGGHLVPASTPKGARSVFRVVTALAPPFVMEGELDEDGQCLRGLECHRLLTSDKDNLTLVFNEMDHMEDSDPKHHLWGISYPRYKYVTSCCYGLAMDLLENVAEELEFDFHLYVVADGMHGSRKAANKWNGVVGDLMSGAAHMSFAALSVNSPRSEVIDFSVPYFFSGVSLLAAPKQRTDIPLLAFLLPFSPELWIAIFTSLNVTAVAVAIYEWLSPFGLNPWGRQRSKNFSMSSAMWVCWGLLCGHLVAFKAPKSWPNKFLINVWGGFSVIFVASYTANIAALIAGLFFHNAVGDYHDRSLLSQRVATPKASAADYYIHKANQILWDHVQKYSVSDVAEGVKHLKNGTLDVLIADTPILDYYRATDNGCKLHRFGDTINEDTYAVGMTKGFPLRDSISAVMAKYSSNGYMDILQEKWYGGLPCFKLATEMAQPRPLGVAAVAGVFLLLGLGMVVGCLILLAEHLFYRYTLPILRHKPKGTIWRSRNIMFFSQKLYRFINCVELVSPHHAARELVHTIRQGQITSLFQKSVKRKEHEQRRRRRSKAQFFEMIQEIRRVQQEERVSTTMTPHLSLPPGEGGRSPRSKKLQLTRSPQFLSPPDPLRRNSRLPSKLELARRLSRDVFRSKSSGNLRRMSSDISMGRLLDCHSSQAIGRRLSRDTNLSPPDINSRRASYLSDGRRVPSMDIGSNCDITSAPKSPNFLTTGHIPAVQSIPDNILTPSGLLPDAAVSRFSYIDIKSPSFKNKLPRMHEPAGLSLSLGDRHPTSWTSSFSELNPRVIVCDNNKMNPSPGGLSIVEWSNNDQKPERSDQKHAGTRSNIDQKHERSNIDQKHERSNIDQKHERSNIDQKQVSERSNIDQRYIVDQKHNFDDSSIVQKHTGDRSSINNDLKHIADHSSHDHSTNSDNQKQKQSTWSNTSINSTEHMIQIIIPSEEAVPKDATSSTSGSSAVTSIKSSPKVVAGSSAVTSIKSSPKVVAGSSAVTSIKSSPKVVADQKMALNLVLNELKERCKEVNAAASDAPPSTLPKIVSYIPKKPARKSLENAGVQMRSLDDAGSGGGASAVEKRRAAAEHRGKSLDRIGDRKMTIDNLVDKPPPLPVKKERRRVHKVRSSECCERLSVAETSKCAAEVACGKPHAACDRTRDRRPLITSRSNDEATSNRVARDGAMSARRDDTLSRTEGNLNRHKAAVATLDRKDVTSPKTST